MPNAPYISPHYFQIPKDSIVMMIDAPPFSKMVYFDKNNNNTTMIGYRRVSANTRIRILTEKGITICFSEDLEKV